MELEIERSNSAQQVDLRIPATVQQAGGQHSQQHYTAANQWQGYLNYLCLSVSLSWLSTSLNGCVQPGHLDPASFWELVEGSIVTVGECRLCLLPHTSCDRSELRVPREWIEIPHWIADYYLAVQIDLDTQRAIVWGYTTHDKLRKQGFYDDLDRMYCLDADDLIQDFSILQLTQELSLPQVTRGPVDPLEQLTNSQADRYLTEWSSPELVCPRLEIREADFPRWLSLISNDRWRKQLTNNRLGLAEPVVVQE
jgi:hypothetical protein